MFAIQLSWGIILGSVLTYFFGWYFAQRDTSDWENKFWPIWKHIAKKIVTVIFFTATLALLILIIVNYDDYDSDEILTLTMCTMFLLSLFVYVMRFRPSPRSIWVKLRKCIGYYLIFSLYISIVSKTIPLLELMKSGNTTTYLLGNLLGNILSDIFSLLIIFFLIRKYSKDKLHPYKVFERETINTHNIISNTKRLLAYYIGYETILFVACSIIIILRISEGEEIGIPVAIFALLTIIPIGIYWMLRLLKESKE